MFEREFSLSWALRNVGWPKYLFAESTFLRRLLAGGEEDSKGSHRSQYNR